MSRKGSRIWSRFSRNWWRPSAYLGWGFVVWPVVAAVCLNVLFDVSLPPLTVIGAICVLVGSRYFLSQEDEFLVALVWGGEILATVGVLYLLGK